MAREKDRPNVALISMPWASAWMPSIQLSILRQCLDGVADADSYEFYVDYAATISEPLYRRLCEAGGIIEEWVFAKHYFEGEGIAMHGDFLAEFPSFGLETRALERQVVSTLPAVTSDFLNRLVEEHDWSQYDVLAFSLSIYQCAPSMALARLIKIKHPRVKVVFGGNSCVGPAAMTMLKICPYIDVVVRTEAEPVFAGLVRRLHSGGGLADLPGVSFRDEDGALVETPAGGLHQPSPGAAQPNFDAYFERFERVGLSGREDIWLPFESSRGCWWGEKSQCTFCGLHEIMRYRTREAQDVLVELDNLYERYGMPRFFSTDLIFPHTYYQTFLPNIISSGRKYEFFYEIKANVRRDQVEMLAAAGVRWLQPGLESLSTASLNRMKKGLTGTGSVQFLKWATEYGLDVGWNMIVGMPGEDPTENDRIAEKIPALHHLQAPHLIQFELDRFSPIFDHPTDYGITNIKPLFIYKYIYPIDDELLSSLVYRFEYDSKDFGGRPPWLGREGSEEYASSLRKATEEWRAAFGRGASLRLMFDSDGSAVIDDRRAVVAKTFRLDCDAASLYTYLDSRRKLSHVAQGFAEHDPAAFRSMGGEATVSAQIGLWLEDQLLFEENGEVVGLAFSADQGRKHSNREQVFSADDSPLDSDSVVSYLRQQGLANDTVVGVVEVRSLRPAFVVRLSDGRALFLKQGQAGPVLPGELEAISPKLLLTDPAQGILVFEGLAHHRSWHELLASFEGFRPEFATKVGRLLSDIHGMRPPDDQGPLSRPPQSVLAGFERLTTREFAEAPGFHFREFLRLAQRVAPRLRELTIDEGSSCFVHGDFKADNILIGPGLDVQVVDWELAHWGDPMRDLGAIIGSVILEWLALVPAGDGTSLEEWFERAPVSSLTLGRCLAAAAEGYFGRRPVRAHEDGIRRAWLHAGVFLLERGLMANLTAGRLNVSTKLSIELGTSILESPSKAVAAFEVREFELV